MKKCKYCGKDYPDEATDCAIDGQPLDMDTVNPPVLPKPSKPDLTPVPTEIRRFNWGAFMLTAIWAAGNKAFDTPTIILTVLCFVPLVNLIAAPCLMFYCGFNGNENSWRMKQWESVERFLEVQRKWTFWAIIINVTILFFSLFFIMLG